MLPYFHKTFAPFLLVIILSILPEVLLNFMQHIFSKIVQRWQFSNGLPHFTINFLKRILSGFFKKVMVRHSNVGF